MELFRAKEIYNDCFNHFKDSLNLGEQIGLQVIGMADDRILWVPSDVAMDEQEFYKLCRLLFIRFNIKYYGIFTKDSALLVNKERILLSKSYNNLELSEQLPSDLLDLIPKTDSFLGSDQIDTYLSQLGYNVEEIKEKNNFLH